MSSGEGTLHAHTVGACGALGRFDRDRVRRMAGLAGTGLREVHRDRRSTLWLDREPIRWQGPAERGLAWSESPRRPMPVASAGDAATVLDACGLVVRGRRRLVHSSPSGLSPVFWLDEDGATYFCSRIDPLVQTTRQRLRADWTAWAAILRLGYALGTRTPFEEVRRLEHSASLERGPAGPLASRGRWPWAEEPLIPFDDAAERLAEAVRAEIESLDGLDLILGLSGGGDSRVLLAALVADGVPPGLRAFTLPGTWGMPDDEQLARRAAAAVGVRHSVFALELEGYWRDAEAVASATEFQQALEWAWFAPLARQLEAGRPAMVLDGLAGDILIRGKFEPVAGADGDVPPLEAVWRRIQRGRNPRGLLRRDAGRAITGLAWAQLESAWETCREHPAAASLLAYRTRTTRGMSGGVATLARAAPTAAPLATDAVARAAMACPPDRRATRELQRAVIARLAPALAEVPVTIDDPGAARPIPQRRKTEETIAGFRELLRESPFRPWFRGDLRDAVEDGSPPALAKLGRNRLVNGLAMHALWLRRYGDRLRSKSPRRLLG